MSAQAAPGQVRRLYAVCGSTGKATTCYLLEHILSAIGRSTALLTTVELKVGPERRPVERLTVTNLPEFLASADDRDIDDTIVEQRWKDLVEAGIERDVDVALFTHLDAAMAGQDAPEQTELAAALLGRAELAVVLVDDATGADLAARTPGAVTVGTKVKGQDADWQVSINATRIDHIDFTLTHRDGRSVSTSLWIPARFSVGYAALAMVAAVETGTTGAVINRLLPDGLRPVVPGRMERVANHPRCIVDVGHNPARLARVIDPLKQSTKGKLTVVLGARGEDPVQLRQAIGAAVAHADAVVVTDDDCGVGIDPAAVRADVIAGLRAAGGRDIAEVFPREAAIRGTVAMAAKDDTVVILGRGHRTRLVTGDAVEHLDDREEVRAGLAQRDMHAAAQ